MEKTYSVDRPNWFSNWDTFLDFMVQRKSCAWGDLVGEKYFEGEKVLIQTKDVVDVEAVVGVIHALAFEVMGEWGEDYPNFTEEEAVEFQGIIVAFLDRVDGRKVFNIESVVEKTITAEDLDRKP
jgi:hypothetical protein